MLNRLVVGVLGNRDSGKTHTWATLFGRPVRTGREVRRLSLTPTEDVEVFLISGSPEERKEFVGDLVKSPAVRIVLCSMQYTNGVEDTIDFFANNGYHFFLQWLNPGYRDVSGARDTLGLLGRVLNYSSVVGIRDGKIDATSRVNEIRDFLYGWARSRGLLLKRGVA